MTSKVKDLSYWKLSELSYKTKLRKTETVLHKDIEENWEVLHRKSIKGTGFDATVFKNGNNLVIAYRGTEGNDPLGRGFADIVTDARYVVFKQKERLEKFPSQFTDGVEFAKEIEKKYPNAKISLTGHSLGGAIASYTAALVNMEAVTYSSPSVMDILPDDIKEKAESGQYDTKIINYVHPQDSVGAGYISEYKRHIGSTYYIGSRFKIENADDIDNPLTRLIDSVATYHGLNMYKFDEYGNISNSVLTNVKTGKELWQSPRYQSNVPSSTIQVNPHQMINFADQIESRMDSFKYKHSQLKSNILSYHHIREASGIGDEVLSSITKFYHWYENETILISKMIKEAGQMFDEVDKRLSKE